MPVAVPPAPHPHPHLHPLAGYAPGEDDASLVPPVPVRGPDAVRDSACAQPQDDAGWNADGDGDAVSESAGAVQVQRGHGIARGIESGSGNESENERASVVVGGFDLAVLVPRTLLLLLGERVGFALALAAVVPAAVEIGVAVEVEECTSGGVDAGEEGVVLDPRTPRPRGHGGLFGSRTSAARALAEGCYV